MATATTTTKWFYGLHARTSQNHSPTFTCSCYLADNDHQVTTFDPLRSFWQILTTNMLYTFSMSRILHSLMSLSFVDVKNNLDLKIFATRTRFFLIPTEKRICFVFRADGETCRRSTLHTMLFSKAVLFFLSKWSFLESKSRTSGMLKDGSYNPKLHYFLKPGGEVLKSKDSASITSHECPHKVKYIAQNMK